MVGIFSRFSSSRAGHRRTQSAFDEKDVSTPNSENTGVTAVSAAASHVPEVSVEFKPVEHPIEPQDIDRPIQCPLPEPSILNDGRIWKERVSANARMRSGLPSMKEGEILESEISSTKPQPTKFNRSILPSLSAPEHNILNLLEECNASGI